MPYRFKFDDETSTQVGPYTRIPYVGDGTVQSLGEQGSAMFERLAKARRLQLTLLQPQGPELTFDFNVTGAATAINAILCK